MIGAYVMTFDELINSYRKRINIASNKKEETAKILNEINHLTCNDEPITEEQKLRILEKLRETIITESFLVHAQDNNDHLELINSAIKALKGK